MDFNADLELDLFERPNFIWKGKKYPLKDISFDTMRKIRAAGAEEQKGNEGAVLVTFVDCFEGLTMDIVKPIDIRVILRFMNYMIDVTNDPDKTMKKKTEKS